VSSSDLLLAHFRSLKPPRWRRHILGHECDAKEGYPRLQRGYRQRKYYLVISAKREEKILLHLGEVVLKLSERETELRLCRKSRFAIGILATWVRLALIVSVTRLTNLSESIRICLYIFAMSVVYIY